MAQHAIKSNKWISKALVLVLALTGGLALNLSSQATVESVTQDIAWYSGPLPVKLNPGLVPASRSTDVVLSGERLTGVSAAIVDGVTVTVRNVTATSLAFSLPALQPGTYSVKYLSTSGAVTHQDSLIVRGTTTSPRPAGRSFYVTERFTNYLGDKGSLVSSDLRAITAFIEANPGITRVTCQGSTSGVPAIASDTALALSRAESACDIVEELIPGVTVKYATSTGKGVGQFYRAVKIYAAGTAE